jgi:putative glutamine amidotransferase
MSRPVIGIVSSLKSDDPNLCTINKVVSVNHSYVLSVLGSGGLPLILPPSDSDDAIAEMVESVDGLLITGGNDLRPQLYGEEPGWDQGSFSPERDHLDFASIRAALEQKKPIFGICRGIQAINVYFGGTLYQDLREEKSCTVKHSQDSESSCWSHTVEISRKSILYPVLGKTVRTNSFHHQAVKKAAEGFLVGAAAKDGIVEAIEKTEGSWILGVQWHPELMASSGDPVMQKVFGLFVDACEKHRSGRSL